MGAWLIVSLPWVVVLLAVAFFSSYRLARAKREAAIRNLVFTSAMFAKLSVKHAHLSIGDCQLVARALRIFFLAHLKSPTGIVGMPSLVTDDLWHEFILNTHAYSRFCDAAFGRFFHHLPTGAMGRGNKQDQALRLTWRYACLEENINPRRPTRPPLLFAIDQKLKIAGGARYTLKRSERDEADVGDENFACSGGLISDSSGAGEGFSGMGGDFGGAGAQGGSCGGDSGGGSSCSGGGGCGGE